MTTLKIPASLPYMKVTLILIATASIAGCTYSPKDDHSRHTNTNHYYGDTSSNKRQTKDEDFVQYKQNNNSNLSDGAPFYNEGLKPRETYHHPTAAYDRATVVHSSQYIPYTPIPYIAAMPNRSIYYVERGF